MVEGDDRVAKPVALRLGHGGDVAANSISEGHGGLPFSEEGACLFASNL
jgi:hypothetical protein